MKIFTINKNYTLALFYFNLIALTTLTNAIDISHFDDNNINNINKKNVDDLINNLENKIKKKINIRKNKSLLKFRSLEKNHTRIKKIPENQLKFIENFNKNIKNTNNKSHAFASWFIFVPLVLLIFIMTILSIAGFLILMLNSTSSTSLTDKKTLLIDQISRLNRQNISNQDIINILRYKHDKNKMKSHSNYKPEPEPEAILLSV